MQADYEKEICFFVGGNGNKTGVEIAGGCTKEWLAAQNGDPSALFGTDGGCVYANPAIQIGTNRRITGAAGTFAGVQAGMVAWISANEFSSAYYEVTAVGASHEYVEFGGADEVFVPEMIGVWIGGAFSDLLTATFRTGGYAKTCYILINKNETLGSTLTLHYAGGDPARNTFKITIGYYSHVFIENGCVISDMDAGKEAYQSALDVLQNGITVGKKVVLDGSGLSAIAVSWQETNLMFRNLHIRGGAGYACVQPLGGTALQYKGSVFSNCIFEGGLDGIKTNGLADSVICQDCIAVNNSGCGFNLLNANNAGKSAVLQNCIADGCGTGFAASGGSIVAGCIAEDCTKGIETNGAAHVTGCVLYNCLQAAFVCSAVTARWEIFNTIAVLNENAAGIFKIGSGGGSVVYEDYNCFIDRLGNSVALHDNNGWPWDYTPSQIGGHTLQVNPLFVNAAAKDYRLQSGSPCVNAGRPMPYGIKTSIGFYEAAESEGGEGGNNVQVNINVQYGQRNKQYS